MRFWLPVWILLAACSRDVTFPLDPTENYSVRLAPARNLALPEKTLAHRLKPPAGYLQLEGLQIAKGAYFQQFDLQKRPDPRYTLRSLLLAPRVFKQLQILFSDKAAHPLYAPRVLERTDVRLLMNGTFFGQVPAGDILGLRCKELGKLCIPGIYARAEQATGKNLNRRYVLAIDRKGKASVFRGGLKPKDYIPYRLAMGGGLLLFDKSLAPELYRAVGSPAYSRFYASGRYNHADLVARGQGGDPTRHAPRMAAGILSDGSLLLVTLGEGKYRHSGGADPAMMARLLRQLGAIKAVMFDGGGSPQLAIKNQFGELMVRSFPEITSRSNYLYNYAFLTLRS